MLMSYTELVQLVEDGVIYPVVGEHINGSSIDVTLGNTLIVELNTEGYAVVDPRARTNFPHKVIHLDEGGHYDLAPGEFVLASTAELFNLPSDISAEFRLKSSGARSGLNNLFACHCDPLWNGSTLTLELHNTLRFTHIRLTRGMRIGQMLFHRHRPVPIDKGYDTRGRYNGDTTTTNVKE